MRPDGFLEIVHTAATAGFPRRCRVITGETRKENERRRRRERTGAGREERNIRLFKNTTHRPIAGHANTAIRRGRDTDGREKKRSRYARERASSLTSSFFLSLWLRRTCACVSVRVACVHVMCVVTRARRPRAYVRAHFARAHQHTRARAPVRTHVRLPFVRNADALAHTGARGTRERARSCHRWRRRVLSSAPARLRATIPDRCRCGIVARARSYDRLTNCDGDDEVTHFGPRGTDVPVFNL